MLDPFAESHLLTFLIFGSLTGLLGLLDLVLHMGKKRPTWQPLGCIAASLALLGAGAALAGWPSFAWQPLLGLGGIGLVLACLRSPLLPLPQSGLAFLARKPFFQTSFLVLLGLGIIGWQSALLDLDREQDLASGDSFLSSQEQVPDLSISPNVVAYTDSGNTIPVWVPSSATSMVHPPEVESQYLSDNNFASKVTLTEPARANYNCHGWIFTGGRFWVRGFSVDQILRDNQYQVVTIPQPDDLAIFRDDAGEVSHTALVRSVDANGEILLESKWGQMGRYLHKSTEHAYTHHQLTYYHSHRNGHLLTGLNPDEARPDFK